jgi:preprotein translocase SecF subunit
MIFGLNYGIDFRGGTMIMMKTPSEVSVNAVRNKLNDLQVGDISVTGVSDPTPKIVGGQEKNLILIKIEQQQGEEAVQNAMIIQVKSELIKKFPNSVFQQTESVGSKVSGELIQTAIWAIILAVIAVLFYIWIRFEWQFSLGAILALVHDVLLTVGIFSILGLEFNLSIIAALLTIVGYSLNDTVIVFDRVRENLRKFTSLPLITVLNQSINDTLSRTVMTSVTTLLALLALYFLGGEVIRGFTFAMIWGVLVGTYSSIFVSSAILLRLGVKRDWSKANSNPGTNFSTD